MCKPILVAVFLICLLVMSGHGGTDFPVLKGPYLGQTPPGTTPAVFAPGVVSTAAHEFSCCFAPDGSEFYFTRRDPELRRPVILMTKLVDGAWTPPEAAPFSVGHMCFEPRITPRGDRLYFTSDRPLPGGGPPMNIWFVPRQKDGWGEPQNPGDPFNPMKTMYISAAADGTIYTMDISAGMGRESIVVIHPENEGYGPAEKLPAPLNTGQRNTYPYITPDGNCLLFCSEGVEGAAGSFLFVSCRGEDGTWQEPQAVDVGMEVGLPLLSPDGKYLFFTAGERGKSDIYWVDAAVIGQPLPEGNK